MGSVCIGVVIGPWRRVEILQRRLVKLTPSPSDPSAGDIFQNQVVECHEGTIQLTEQNQPLQLVVFQTPPTEHVETASHQYEGYNRTRASHFSFDHQPDDQGEKAPDWNLAPSRWCLA